MEESDQESLWLEFLRTEGHPPRAIEMQAKFRAAQNLQRDACGQGEEKDVIDRADVCDHVLRRVPHRVKYTVVGKI